MEKYTRQTQAQIFLFEKKEEEERSLYVWFLKTVRIEISFHQMNDDELPTEPINVKSKESIQMVYSMLLLEWIGKISIIFFLRSKTQNSIIAV